MPLANVREGAIIDGIEIIGVANLSETIEYLREVEERKTQRITPAIQTGMNDCEELDIDVDLQISMVRQP